MIKLFFLITLIRKSFKLYAVFYNDTAVKSEKQKTTDLKSAASWPSCMGRIGVLRKFRLISPSSAKA